MSADAAAVSTAEHAGFTLTGSGAEEAVASLQPETPTEAQPEGKPDIAKAASELGKLGAKAAAKARKEAAKVKPIADPDPAPEAEPAEKAGAVEAPAEEAAEEAPEGETAEQREERKSRAAERVKEATRQAAEAKREAARLRDELDRIRQEAARSRQAEQPKESRPEPRRDAPAEKPKPDDFENYEDYLDARDTFNREQWEAERAQRDQAERRQQRIGGMAKTFADHVKKAIAEEPEFLDNLSPEVRELSPSFALVEGETPTARNWIADALVRRPEHAAQVMRHLTANPEDFKRLKALPSPYDVAYETGLIVARLEGAIAGNPTSAERPAPKPAVSKAPPPVRPVTGAPSSAVPGGYREGMSFDEWLARNRKGPAAR
jgi:hypothetical protein